MTTLPPSREGPWILSYRAMLANCRQSHRFNSPRATGGRSAAARALRQYRPPMPVPGCAGACWHRRAAAAAAVSAEPVRIATIRAVSPNPSCASLSTLRSQQLARRLRRARRRRPAAAASHRRLSRVSAATCAPSRNFTVATCPASAAAASGVSPSRSARSSAAPRSASKPKRRRCRPARHTRRRVRPCASGAVALAPASQQRAREGRSGQRRRIHQRSARRRRPRLRAWPARRQQRLHHFVAFRPSPLPAAPHPRRRAAPCASSMLHDGRVPGVPPGQQRRIRRGGRCARCRAGVQQGFHGARRSRPDGNMQHRRAIGQLCIGVRATRQQRARAAWRRPALPPPQCPASRHSHRSTPTRRTEVGASVASAA